MLQQAVCLVSERHIKEYVQYS